MAILAILYSVGLVGIHTQHGDWFIAATPITLLLTVLLLLCNHRTWSANARIVLAIVAVGGFLVEVLGVKTGLLFGEYAYGATLGPKLWQVPLVIGVNWLLLTYACGVVVARLRVPRLLQAALAAALMTALDVLIEPIAMRLDYWQWPAGQVPFHNFAGWFVVAFCFQIVFLAVRFEKQNPLATATVILQCLFFGILNLTHDMDLLLKIAVLLLTFCFMEFMAWFTHKYVMHGLLWYLHRDHHQKGPGWFERNDAFFLIFATPSWLLIMTGMMGGYEIRVWIGAGIALYGLAYFLVHEIFIHQRFRLFRKSDNVYLRAIRRAHKMHHKHLGKEDGECFGMLVVPLKYFKEARAALQKDRSAA